MQEQENELTKKLSDLSMDSAYGSLPRNCHYQFTAGEILVHSLELPIVYTNQQLLNELMKKYAQKRAIDVQGLLDFLVPSQETILPRHLDLKVLGELEGLTYSYLDSHIDVIMYRFMLEFTIETLQDFIKQGWRYLCGLMLPQDEFKAIQWFRRAVANVVDPASIEACQALSLLGYCFMTGAGTVCDHDQAVEYFIEATKYTNNSSKLQLIEFVAGHMEQVGGNKLLTWLSPLVFQGYPPAQYLMATWHYQGKFSLQKNPVLAARLFSFSAKQGFAPGMFQYSHCLEHGIGCPRNGKEATVWLHEAAQQGHTEALYRMQSKTIEHIDRVQLQPFSCDDKKLSVSWLILSL
jgi:hypothetical protein